MAELNVRGSSHFLATDGAFSRHAQDVIQEPLQQWATGRSIQRRSTILVVPTMPITPFHVVLCISLPATSPRTRTGVVGQDIPIG